MSTTTPAPTPGDIALRQALKAYGLVAILRGSRPDAPLVETVRNLADAGVRCIEVTLPTPGSLDAVTRLRGELPDEVLLGVGTVTEQAQVRRVKDAGGQFIVSPICDHTLVMAARSAKLGSLPGCFTPSEGHTAWQAGASAVKLFPAEPLGPAAVKAWRGPLPQIPLVPTGGVALADVRPYLEAGALAVGVGSPLVGDALEGGSQAELAERARAFVKECGR
ncbi:bifunctional 4-hydroxy-2-oxoglutarate aldolase/2-dehydro-3-deoxy-phosphogluconate aldolase [Streptomyces sp. NPDC050738]|uniref:bifunctional 4-hydroxy-2-oxoglutarate aldolase/2-dehydro-3-deoxy-phosphogluconate aldolase n=1 Tax=Streptomyces sp. NPDC050738 TaxID=3154744 RepID=UPI0034354F74